MYYRSHKWVDTPHTVYERRRELRVRESKHTMMVFDRKYLDIDTGRYNTDKLYTLNSSSLVDMMDCASYGDYGDQINHVGRTACDVYLGLEEVYNACKFPDRQKKIEKQRRKEERENQRILAEQNAKHAEWLAYKEELRQRNEDYERRVRERENELARQRLIREQQQAAQEMIYLGGANHGQRIITSKWGRG